jgi:hypothetical protein
MMRILSLGWGVQSWTLAAMVALGELEPVDAVIHADTTHEATGTYDFARRWTPWLEERGVRVVTVSANSTQRIWAGEMIPAFTNNETPGQALRTCTQRWKIAPIRRWLQANRNGAPVEVLLGISMDEALRMKPADVKYITHRWPLIERRMSRNDCARWLEAHDLEVPPKSSCVFCPYHNTAAWRELKQSGNGDWHKAVEVDQAIRKARPPYDLFVHPARIPLEEVDLRSPQEMGQMSLWDEECSGLCGV